MATIFGGPQYENRSWSKNTVTLRFDKDGNAEVDDTDVPALDLHLHREFTVVDDQVEVDEESSLDPHDDPVEVIGGTV